MTNPCFRNRKA